VIRRLLLLGLAAGALPGCGNSANTAGALGNVGIGLISSAISRASGGCYSVCSGTDVCDSSTGWCEPNPCGPGCGGDNRCDTLSGPLPQCVPLIPPAPTEVEDTVDPPVVAFPISLQPTLLPPPPPPRDPRVPQ
jgi:hypothetical protein